MTLKLVFDIKREINLGEVGPNLSLKFYSKIY